MLPRVRATFLRLERRLQSHFSGDLRLWWPASAGLKTYTVPIVVRQTDDRGDSADLPGTLGMDAGTVTLQALVSDFPFVPDENMTFVLSPSDGGTPPAPVTLRKYLITAVNAPEMFGHYTITARSQ